MSWNLLLQVFVEAFKGVVCAIDHDVQSVFCLHQAAVFLDQVIDIPRRRQVHASAYMYESAYDMRYYMHAQTLACGDMYEGDWKDDRKSGKGAYTWAYGDMYEGDYKGGEVNRKGTCA